MVKIIVHLKMNNSIIISKTHNSEVYKVTDENNRVYIIKKGKNNQIENEKEHLDILHHPNIISMFDYYNYGDNKTLILEYINGGDLCDYILSKEKPLQEKEVIFIFSKIIKGLKYAHSMGVCHRDIKAENILLSREENGEISNVVIADWGLANNFNVSPHNNNSCGTLRYSAPEIVRQMEYRGPEVDIWSLGVLLYVMLTRYFPFSGNNNIEIARNIVKGKILRQRDLNSEVKDLIDKMLATNIAERINIDQVINHQWVVKHN